MAEMGPVLTSLQRQFQGRLLTPGDLAYECSRRIWNGMVDKKPRLIVQCETPVDVRTAVKLARSEGMTLSVRGGGHGVAGHAVCDGGLMLDLSLMKEVSVNAVRLEATAAPGVLWGEFDQATQAHGLATTGGQVSHTGIAGLTLGGGLGYLMGKHGATCDNLLSVDLVTADGEMLTASADKNADLFWAIRGAGANFGVVTSFRYRLHPLGRVLAGLLLHPRAAACDLIAFLREFLAGSPDELYTTIAFLNSPEGAPLAGTLVVWAGDFSEGEHVLQPLRKFGSPIADLIQPMAYTDVQRMLDNAAPIGHRYYWKSNFVNELSSGLASVLTEGAGAMASPYSMILLFEMKGEILRGRKDSMAFDHRDPGFELSIVARWADPANDDANIRWARSVWGRAQPYVSSAVYTNHLTADESRDRVLVGYGAEKYKALGALKVKYDPENLFRSNHNIPPVP